MTGDRYRVGILGAGQAGERHAVGFGALAQARIAGVVDVNPARAEALAHAAGAQVYPDLEAMLAAGLDILVIALPHGLHVAPAQAAAEAGVHVMMEKPLATTAADGAQIVEVCRRKGVKLGVSFVHRFRDESQLLYEWIRDGKLGTPRLARETMAIERGPDVPAWVMDPQLGGGGVVMYSAIHSIDRVRWLVGDEVISVHATTCTLTPPGHSEPEVEDGVAALLTFAGGATATLTASAPVYPSRPAIWESEVVGTEGMGRLRTRGWAQLSRSDGELHVDTADVAEKMGPHYNFVRQAAGFVQAIDQDTRPPVDGEDGLAALHIALAIYASADQGKPVAADAIVHNLPRT